MLLRIRRAAMASNLPIPQPPRTPTPPTPNPEEDRSGLGIYGGPRPVSSTVSFDPNSLSPMTDTFPHRFGSMVTPIPSSGSIGSPATSNDAQDSDASSGAPAKNPFNFQTQTYTMAPVAKSVSSIWLRDWFEDKLTQTEHWTTARPQIQAQ